MNKQAEKDRLHDIVFDGVDKRAKYVAMNKDGLWITFYNHPLESVTDTGCWHGYLTSTTPHCKNQPETTLDWTETLLERKE